jgi:protein O-mannosyl-transferase
MTRRPLIHKCLIAAGLVLLVAIIYWPTARYPFVKYDDDGYVYENRHVATGLSVENIRWDFGIHPDGMGAYSPLTFLSHQLCVQLFGVQSAGAHHLVNVIFHAIAVVLLFVWLSRMTQQIAPSAIVAALFAVHPLHVQSVAWVAERKDCLCAAFVMATLLVYERYARRPTWWRYVLILLLFASALLAKPLAVTLPAAMLLLDYWPLARIPGHLRRCIVEKIPLFILSAGASALNMADQAAAQAMTDAHTPVQCIENAIISYVIYLRKAIWPDKLAVFYPFPAEIPIWKVAVCAAILLVATGIAVLWARRRPYVTVGWFWYLGVMLPMSGVVQVGAQAWADRYAYLPLIGIYIIVAFGAADALRASALPRRIYCAFAAAIIAALAVNASIQVHHWSSGEALFRHAIAVTRGNYIAHNNLGAIYLLRGNRPAAMGEFEEALRENPDHIDAINNIAMQYAQDGRYADALNLLRRGEQLWPRHFTTRYNIGYVLLRMNRPTEAEVELRAALAIDSDHDQAHYNLAAALMRQGKFADAIPELRTVLAVKPTAADAWNNLGICCEAMGRVDDAMRDYERALQEDPLFAPARANLDRMHAHPAR